MNIFEGLPNRFRPSFKATNLASGILKTIGTMIAHSLLMDGQGFPYLSEYCYYYIADRFDEAISCIGSESEVYHKRGN